ncbi:MAG TPA: PD-(D/E)XK nuclease family protein [Williamwhitmania sp.]|nr:PD-(D/E)XK nuclease family protein [Williamwhitmania sp.]
MEPFLSLVAHDLHSRYGEELNKINLVFPTRRAGLFFARYLSRLIEKPQWHPKVYSISDLMYMATDYKAADQLSLVLDLHKIYCKVKDSEETFDNFYFWGEVMLTDFDLVDKYRVDHSLLFRNIQAIKELEGKFEAITPEQREALAAFINLFDKQDLTPIRSNFLTIWEVLGSIYQDFKSLLEEKNLAYEGMAYRAAADKFSGGGSVDFPDGLFAFIGFNALNSCEKELFRYFKREDRALFYWDYDTYYTQDEVQEAGAFIRVNLKEFPNAIAATNFSNFKEKRKITVINTPTGVAQAKLVPMLLNEVTARGGKLDESCAIIFPEEHYLLPVLRSLPDDIERLNITMGYPIKETPAYTLVDYLMKLQLGARTTETSTRYYHRDVLALLSHPYISIAAGVVAKELMNNIADQNRIYPNATFLHKNELFELIFSPIADGIGVFDYLRKVTVMLTKQIATIAQNDEAKESMRMDIEYLYALYQSITRLSDILSTENTVISLKVAGHLVRKVFGQQRVSFKGEPLAGLQLMGFLETRALDFKNVIILSMNDDVLPGKQHSASFITPSLRIAFQLPDYKHKEAIYAYYFYRLIQRANNVYLIYKNRTDGSQTGEESRYIRQLRLEGRMEMSEKTLEMDINLPEPVTITVDKGKEVMAILNTYLAEETTKYLSPSALTTYISCPLRFYYRYILGLKELEEATEEVDLPLFGSIFHQVMNLLLQEHQGKVLTAEMLTAMAENKQLISETVTRAFRIEFFKDEAHGDEELQLMGRNLIVKDAIEQLTVKMLLVDAQRAPLTIMELEKKYDAKISFGTTGQHQVTVGGVVDRLEQVNETLMVVDYKTGSAKKSSKNKGTFSSIDDLFNRDKIADVKEVFQTFIYCEIVKRNHPNATLRPALWFVRRTEPTYRPGVTYKTDKSEIGVDTYADFATDFQHGLDSLLSELFNPEVPFTQTTVEDACKVCPYKDICAK